MADSAFTDALTILATAPNFVPVGEWLDTAFAVRERRPRVDGAPASLGVLRG